MLLDGNTTNSTSLYYPCHNASLTTPANSPVVIYDQDASAELDVVMRNSTLGNHDTSWDTRPSYVASRANAGSTCVALSNNTAVNGYRLRENAGTFELEQGVSASTDPATVLSDNNNTGTATIDGSGSVGVTVGTCEIPSGGIF